MANPTIRLLLATAFLLGLSTTTHAQRPTMRSLLAQRTCADTLCMGRYADSLNFCQRPTPEPDAWLWFSCAHLAEGRMNVFEGTGLLFFASGRGDRGYTIQTFDQAYAQDLTTELRDLGFKELKAMPTGSVLASKKYPALEVLRTSKTIPFGKGSSTSYAFTVVVR
jgi:hypothetical protein